MPTHSPYADKDFCHAVCNARESVGDETSDPGVQTSGAPTSDTSGTSAGDATASADGSASASAGIESRLLGLSACLSVADLAATAAWYERVLGFTTVRSLSMPALHAEVAYLRNERFTLELLQIEGAVTVSTPPPPGHAGVHGVTQLTFYVPDAEAAMKELDALGATPVTDLLDVPDLGVRAFFVRDPEGNNIEFIEASWH
jgi:catechol 2,3-dioxygenase-like lactoylglutathione lyase family enzyme